MPASQTLTFGDVLREHRRSRPSALAVVDGDVRLTYPQLDDRVNRLASSLGGLGVGAGDRVLWFGQNSHRLLETLLACAKVGAVMCPSNWRASADELAFVVEDFSPAVVVWQDAEIGAVARAARAAAGGDARWFQHDAGAGEGDSLEALVAKGDPADAEVEVDDRSPLLALYTAAFEGTPQAALLSHAALVVQNLVVGRMHDIGPSSVFLNSGPLFHIATFMMTNATFHHGGTNVFVARAEADDICRLVEAERCTHAFVMPPTMEEIRRIHAGGDVDLSSLWPGADPAGWPSGMVTPDSAPWATAPGGFGQTEVIGLATFRGLDPTAAGRAGRPVAAQVRLVGPDGTTEVAPGETGEIVVRGPIVMSGYHARPELNAAKAAGGWHHTGDLGRREADGSLSFVGPKTALIKSAAENIYPAEVEACLREHPAVADVCVIGVPDPTWTQSVKAVVVPAAADAPPSLDDLVEHCRARMASYKKPRFLAVTDTLPRLPSGAVDRAAVDAAFGGGGYPGQA